MSNSEVADTVVTDTSAASASAVATATDAAVPAKRKRVLPQFCFSEEWTISRQAIEHCTTSRQDGISLEKETAFRRSACHKVKDLLKKILRLLSEHHAQRSREVGDCLKDSMQRVQAVSMIILHRCTTCISIRCFVDDPAEADNFIAACCFVGCKVEDVEVHSDFVLNAFKKNAVPLDGRPLEDVRIKWRNDLFQKEIELLKLCCFQFNFRLPFDILSTKSAFVRSVSNFPTPPGEKKARRTLVKIAKTIAVDMFLTIAGVVYDHRSVAAAAVVLACAVLTRNPKFSWRITLEVSKLLETTSVRAKAVADICRLTLNLEQWNKGWMLKDGVESTVRELLGDTLVASDGS